MSRLESAAEIAKLARLLAVERHDLAYLEAVPAADLASFREQLTDKLYDGDRERFQRLAVAAKVVPGQISATIAQRALGPMICARLAGLVDTGKAVDIAKRLPTPFLADVAIELDPRRAVAVIARIPATLVGEVAGELATRDETVTLGRFVGHVSDDGLRAALPRIDEATLLRTAFVMEGKERLDHVISFVAQERLAQIIRAAEAEGLWPEAFEMLGHLGPQSSAELASAIGPDATLLDALLRAADREGRWPALLALVDHMDDSGRERVAQIVGEVDATVIEGLADAVEREGLWAQLLAIAGQMSDEQLHGIADRLLQAGLEQRLASLLAAVDQTGLWETGLGILAGVDSELQQRLVAPLATLSRKDRAKVAKKARELGLVEQLGPIGSELAAAC